MNNTRTNSRYAVTSSETLLNGNGSGEAIAVRQSRTTRLHSVYFLLIYVSIICAHLELFAPGGAPVTLTFILVFFLTVPFLRSGPPRLYVILGASALLLLPLLVALLDNDTTLFIFFKTYTLFIIAIYILIIGVHTTNYLVIWDPRFERSLRFALITIVVLSILQVGAGSLGSEFFFNPWGSHQFAYQYEPNIRYYPVPRAAGFYLEPSYNAFVLLSVWVALTLRNRTFSLAYTLMTVAGLLATRSATGLGIFMLILAVAAIKSRRTRLVLPVIVAACVAGGYLIARIASISDAGSSGNYRYVAPLRVLAYVLDNRPVGMPLGSVQRTVAQFDILNGSEFGVTLDNGFYVVVFYYGWIGVLVALAAIICVIAKTVESAGPGKSPVKWVAPLWLFSSLLFSGGIMSTEFVWFSFIVLISSRALSFERGV